MVDHFPSMCRTKAMGWILQHQKRRSHLELWPFPYLPKAIHRSRSAQVTPAPTRQVFDPGFKDYRGSPWPAFLLVLTPRSLGSPTREPDTWTSTSTTTPDHRHMWLPGSRRAEAPPCSSLRSTFPSLCWDLPELWPWDNRTC